MSEIICCPKCNKLFTVTPGQRGQGANCPFCYHSLVVPAPTDTNARNLPLASRGPFPGLMIVWMLTAFVMSCTSTLAGVAIISPSQPEMFLGAACSGAVAIMLQIFLCIGLVRGQRLARQATLVLGCLWLILSVLGILAGSFVLLYLWHSERIDFSTPEQVLPLAILALECIRTGLFVALLVNLTSALGTLRYFGLVCPSCNNPGGQPADLLFKQVRCPSCRSEWRG